MTSLSDKNKSSILTVYITLAFLGSLAALAFLGGIPSDSKNAVIFGFSPLRLAMLAFLAIAALLIGSILFWIFVSRRGMQSAQGFMDRLVTGNTRLGIMWICLLMLVGGIILFLLPQEVLGSRVYIVERLLPILAWAVELSLLTMLLLWLWRREKFTLSLTTEQVAILRTTAIVLGVFLLVGAWILWSRIGLEPDRSGWYSAGTPILFTQVVLAIVIGLVFLRWEGSLADWNSRRRSSTRFLKADTIIFLMLWFTAALIWWLEPMRKWSYFSSEPTPPNFEPYPYSDAGIYDEAAQGLLIGISRNANVMLRPLYSFFLALLHGMIGQDYSLIVLAQVILLAVIPGLVYWIGAKLGSRAAGVVAAVLLLVRERNSIALTNVIEVSHSKLLLSDTPALALMLLFVLSLLLWMRNRNGSSVWGLLTGAALGLLVLVRSQAQLLIPVVLICLILSGGFAWKGIFRKFALFLIGLVLVVLPWIWRNYQVSGNAAVENPEFYIQIFASGYVHPGDSINFLAGENFDDYYARMKNQIFDFILENPAEVAGFYASHYFHNEISSLLQFPISMMLYPLQSYVREMGFWADPALVPSGARGVMIWLNLGIIALGIAAAFQKTGWIGMFPLLIHLGYSLTIVPLRLSGWRFILPVDWVSVLYYSLGLVTLIVLLRSVFTETGGFQREYLASNPIHSPVDSPRTIHPRSTFLAGTMCALVGLSLPFFEIMIPERYPALNPQQIVQRHVPDEYISRDGLRFSRTDLLSFLDSQDGAVILYGRALYPGFYPEGEYWGDDNQFLLAAREHDRLQFRLIGPVPAQIFLPLQNPPVSFPHASDVLVVGCSRSYGVEAMIVDVKGQEGPLTVSPWNGMTCLETP